MSTTASKTVPLTAPRLVVAVKTYRGRRERTGCIVEVYLDGKKSHDLDARLDIRMHSPNGMDWGYFGPGPSQLALAILADATGNKRIAEAYHEDFRRAFVADLPFIRWTLTSEEVHAWLVRQARTDLAAQAAARRRAAVTAFA